MVANFDLAEPHILLLFLVFLPLQSINLSDLGRRGLLPKATALSRPDIRLSTGRPDHRQPVGLDNRDEMSNYIGQDILAHLDYSHRLYVLLSRCGSIQQDEITLRQRFIVSSDATEMRETLSQLDAELYQWRVLPLFSESLGAGTWIWINDAEWTKYQDRTLESKTSSVVFSYIPKELFNLEVLEQLQCGHVSCCSVFIHLPKLTCFASSPATRKAFCGLWLCVSPRPYS